jgi:hypothetical protein
MRLETNQCPTIAQQQEQETLGNTLQVAIEAAGLEVDGKKVRYQSAKPNWAEIWNCAFAASGRYTINLKLSLKGKTTEPAIPISDVEYNASVSSLFAQTLNPLILGVIPAIITAVVTIMTAK